MLLFLCAVLAPAAESARLTEAKNLESKGERTAALRAYKSLMADPRSASEFPAAFEGLLRLETDINSIADSARLLLEAPRTDASFQGLWEKTAHIMEMSGRFELAADLYGKEFSASGSQTALESEIALLIEMNDLETAAARIQLCGNPGSKTLFQAEILLRKGEAASAGELFSALKDATPDAIYGRFAADSSRNDRTAMAASARELALVFPLSPESIIAGAAVQGERGGKTRMYPSAVPAQFLPPQPIPDGSDPTITEPSAQAPATAPAPASASGAAATQAVPDAPARNVSVQAGSYHVRENAEDMVKVLISKGFAAVIGERVIGGRTYFKAFAAASVDITEAKKVLEELRLQGFDGVLYFD